MSKKATLTEAEATVGTVEIDPITVIHKGECPSLSGRSTLEFIVGRHTENGTLHLAITSNSGKGMFCKDWAAASQINSIVIGEEALSGKAFQPLHPGKSVNTFSFLLSAIRTIGLVTNAENSTRLHAHVPGLTFEKAVAAYMARNEVAPTKKSKKLKAAD